MHIGTETVETVKMQGKTKDDTALVAPDQVKEFEARGYSVVHPEAPKDSKEPKAPKDPKEPKAPAQE